MNFLKIPLFCAFILLINSVFAQSLSREEIKQKSVEKLPNTLVTFREFLAIPNDGHFPEQIVENLNWCNTKFTELGFTTNEIISGEIPHLYAEKIIDKKKKTILFYLQIDGQPVDIAKWEQESPFRATIKDQAGNVIPWEQLGNSPNEELKIYARSASDSKGPAMCFISALEIMNEVNRSADFNIKVIMDFQEEMSSPTIADLVNNNRDLLNADYLLIMDGTRHISNLPTLTFGARGIATITLTVFGAKEDLHSGQYGN
ncbi:MAG: M20/M25/M40 family metallo-hydrolase, partial [Spirosomaceae bacterium]|nr:M20/M25/M40 family metallo-hydrolase [Spirosomataceae bacterium]